MQKIGAQYLLRKVKDQVLMPAKEEPVAEGNLVATPSGPDSIVVHDDEGNVIGTAYRVDVEVYAVTYGKGRPDAALARSLNDENAQVLVQREGSRITSVIYVPDPNNTGTRGDAVRADDI
jgi:hypothetical protein